MNGAIQKFEIIFGCDREDMQLIM